MSGITLSNFAPADPPATSTPDSVYDSATKTSSNLIFCVPAFLESWSHDPERVKKLATFDACVCAAFVFSLSLAFNSQEITLNY